MVSCCPVSLVVVEDLSSRGTSAHGVVVVAPTSSATRQGSRRDSTPLKGNVGFERRWMT